MISGQVGYVHLRRGQGQGGEVKRGNQREVEQALREREKSVGELPTGSPGG